LDVDGKQHINEQEFLRNEENRKIKF